MNPYDVLGISKDATPEFIRQKYKELAQIHHPDKGGDQNKFTEIKAAYELLIDPIRRKDYDTTGNTGIKFDIRTEVLEQLAMYVIDALYNMNPEQEDLILIVNNKIVKSKNETLANIALCEKYLKNLNTSKRKIKKKSEQGENLLLTFIQSQIDIKLKDQVMFSNRLKMCEMMHNILNDYQYGDDIATLIENFMATGSIEPSPSA